MTNCCCGRLAVEMIREAHRVLSILSAAAHLHHTHNTYIMAPIRLRLNVSDQSHNQHGAKERTHHHMEEI